MFQSEQLQEKWAPLLNHEGCSEIQDNYRRVCHRSPARKPRKIREEREILSEAFNDGGMLTATQR